MFAFIYILSILDSINLDRQNEHNNCTLQLFCTTIHMHTILINKLSAFRIQNFDLREQLFARRSHGSDAI